MASDSDGKNARLEQKIKKAVADEKIKRIAKEQERSERPAPELIIRKASDIPQEDLSLLFGGRLIQGAFQLMVGPGEAGKGMVSTDIVARLSTGAPFPGESQDRPAVNVLMCVTEDTQGRVVGRLRAAGADLDRVMFVDGPPIIIGGLVMPSPVAFGSDAGAMVKKAKDNQAGALFLETTLEHLGDREQTQRWSTNNEAEVRRALSPIVGICREANIIGWGVMHPRKSSDGGIEDSISGSAAFRNVSRGILHVYRDPADMNGDPWRLMPASKANYLRKRPETLRFKIEPWEKDPAEGRVVWGTKGHLVDERSAEDIWGEIRERNKQARRRDHAVMDAEKFLFAVLENGPVPVKDIEKMANDAGISWGSVKRAKENIKVDSRKDGLRGPFIWSLPSTEL